jgi:hypothetical protein
MMFVPAYGWIVQYVGKEWLNWAIGWYFTLAGLLAVFQVRLSSFPVHSSASPEPSLARSAPLHHSPYTYLLNTDQQRAPHLHHPGLRLWPPPIVLRPHQGRRHQDPQHDHPFPQSPARPC